MTGAIECYTPETTPFGQDPNRDDNENGTADECEQAGPGSRCDTFKQKWPYPTPSAKCAPSFVTPMAVTSDSLKGLVAAHEWDVA